MRSIIKPERELERVLRRSMQDQGQPFNVKMYHTEEDGEQWYIDITDPKITTIERILMLSMAMTEDDGMQVYDRLGKLIHQSGLI